MDGNDHQSFSQPSSFSFHELYSKVASPGFDARMGTNETRRKYFKGDAQKYYEIRAIKSDEAIMPVYSRV